MIVFITGYYDMIRSRGKTLLTIDDNDDDGVMDLSTVASVNTVSGQNYSGFSFDHRPQFIDKTWVAPP